MKRALVAAALGGLLMVGTPTLALSAQRNDTRAEKADKDGDKGRGEKGDRGERGDRGDRGDDDRNGHHRNRHHHDRDYYYDHYYGYPYYGGHPYYGGYYGYPYYSGGRDGDVLVRGLAFNPPEVSIRPGGDVTWMFSDREPHDVTADNKSFGSGPRKDGEFRVRFDQPGAYSYHCAIHPEMKGRVLVG